MFLQTTLQNHITFFTLCHFSEYFSENLGISYLGNEGTSLPISATSLKVFWCTLHPKKTPLILNQVKGSIINCILYFLLDFMCIVKELLKHKRVWLANRVNIKINPLYSTIRYLFYIPSPIISNTTYKIYCQ